MEKLYIAFPSANKNTVLNIVVFMPHDKENLRGMIQICHGMTEHIDRYDDFAEYFTERGYAVFGNDIISHGRSNVNKSWSLYLDDWFDTVRDAINVRNHITKIYPDLPVYIVGFSLGSFIVRSMPDLSAYNKEILVGTGYQPAAMLHVMRGLIAVKFNKQMSKSSDEIRKMAFDSYNKHFKGYPNNYWLLSDDAARNEYEADRLVHTCMTPKFFYEFLRGMEYTSKNLKNPNNTIETLNEAYLFAQSTTIRSIAAFKAYRKTRDKKIRKEIQKNYLLTALSIITFTNEDDFMDFLKLVEVRYNKRILNGLQKKGWLPSVSYILQNIKETEKEDFALS